MPNIFPNIFQNRTGTIPLNDLDENFEAIGSVTAGNGASLVGVLDAAGNYTGTDVEDALAEIGSGALRKSGGTMTGAITMNTGAGTDAVLSEDGIVKTFAGAAEFNISNPAGSLNLKVNGFSVWNSGNDGAGSGLDADTLRGVGAEVLAVADSIATRSGTGTLTAADPTAASHLVTLSYLNGLGISTSRPLQKARILVSTNVNLNAAPDTYDGVSLVNGSRLLLTAQSTGSQNGIYYVSTLGTGADGVWTRVSDYNTNGEVQSGDLVTIAEGTVNGLSVWKLNTVDPIDIDVTSLAFTKISLIGFTGASNTGLGINAGVGITTGLTNTLIGTGAGQLVDIGDNNTLFGYNAGNTITSGVSNTIIGSNADVNAVGAVNRIVIGKDASGTADNAVFLGDANITAIYLAGTKILGVRDTGWTAATGTASKVAYATFTSQNITPTPTETEVQNIDDHVVILSQQLKAIKDVLIAHGLIGA